MKHRFAEGNKFGALSKRGPHRATVEIRELFEQIVQDPLYQKKLREDFRKRRVHPLTESTVWAHTAGKPPTQIDITANIDVNHRYEVEAQLLRSMDLPQLEALAEESQAMIDRAIERMQVHNALQGKAQQKTQAKPAESDNTYFVNLPDGRETPENESTQALTAEDLTPQSPREDSTDRAHGITPTHHDATKRTNE